MKCDIFLYTRRSALVFCLLPDSPSPSLITCCSPPSYPQALCSEYWRAPCAFCHQKLCDSCSRQRGSVTALALLEGSVLLSEGEEGQLLWGGYVHPHLFVFVWLLIHNKWNESPNTAAPVDDTGYVCYIEIDAVCWCVWHLFSFELIELHLTLIYSLCILNITTNRNTLLSIFEFLYVLKKCSLIYLLLNSWWLHRVSRDL